MEQWQGELATYTVTNTNDSGTGSFRQAIIDANNNAGADTINFSIAATGVNTINLSSILPSITGQITINATTESDFAGTPLIVINGGGSITDGLTLSSGADNSLIRGLVIQNFTGNGISIANISGLTIAGNFIGTTSTGNAAAATSNGINLWNVTNSTIGGTTAADRNVVSGNSNIGINYGGGSTGLVISGNYIGVGADGSTDVGNRWFGIYGNSSGATIGGTATGAGNVISGTGTTGGGAHGVYLSSSASGTTIRGNTIGLNAAGSAAVATDGDGLRVLSSGNTIGGTTAGAGNVISGNSGNGMVISGADNIIQGNIVGMNVTGMTKIANGGYGIDMTPGATNTTIGGTTASARNIVSGNGNAGILFETGSSGSVLGNYIGVDATGSTSVAGNGAAVFIATSSVSIGGTAAGAGNIISGSNTHGIIVAGSGSNNSILGNSIWGNSGQAIDLNGDGVTINDYQDSDSGANGLVNTPVLKTATTVGADTTITGKVSGWPTRHFASSSSATCTEPLMSMAMVKAKPILVLPQ